MHLKSLSLCQGAAYTSSPAIIKGAAVNADANLEGSPLITDGFGGLVWRTMLHIPKKGQKQGNQMYPRDMALEHTQTHAHVHKKTHI